jgi:hypothetical protein
MSGLTSKPLVRFSSDWPQNRWLRFSPVWSQNRWLRFFGLDPKIDSSGLMIWASKSPWLFFGLCLKIKHASVYQLRHKTDRGRTACDTRWDLVAYFARKQVALRFPSLVLRLADTWRRVVHMTPGARDTTIAEVTLGSNWRWTRQCDGLRRTRLFLIYHFLCIRP